MIGIDEIISSYPAAINEEGTRWWPHPGITKYAQRYPELKDYAYWIIEDVHQVRHFVITENQKYIKISQSLEDICLYIDMLGNRYFT